MPRRATLFLGLLVLASVAPAQTCPTGSTLAKNDILPPVPPGPLPVAIVPGLCDNEAAGEIFTVGGPVRVHQVGIVYANRFGTNGVQAVADVEIYDGATEDNQGRYSLGPLVFRLSNGGSNLQIQSTAINTYALPTPVRCTSGKVVVLFRMIMNFGQGSCATGYDSNFACDNNNVCRTGQSILDAIGHGPVDPGRYLGFPVPLCPFYFKGNWVLRACLSVETNPNQVIVSGNPVPPGGSAAFEFRFPGHGGEAYYGAIALSSAPGIPVPGGTVPLAPDPLFFLFLSGALNGYFFNFSGPLNSQGSGYGFLSRGTLPPVQVQVAAIAVGPPGITGITDAATLVLQ